MARRRAVRTDAVFAERIDQYPDDWIRCRDTGHHWEPVTAKKDKNGVIFRVLRCTGCGTDRNQVMDRYGYIISTNYSYKNGYTISGSGRLTAAHRAAFRLLSVARGFLD